VTDRTRQLPVRPVRLTGLRSKVGPLIGVDDVPFMSTNVRPRDVNVLTASSEAVNTVSELQNNEAEGFHCAILLS